MDTPKELIDLDVCVTRALEMLQTSSVPLVPLTQFTQPFVVGSGNALVTGKILFENVDALFADESTYIRQLGKRSSHDGAVLISASGAKHAPMIAQALRKRGLKTMLLTNTQNSPAKQFVDETYVFPKNVEPYTYNTSTYLSMIYAKTGEKPKETLAAVKALEKRIPTNLKKYDSFYFILPDAYECVREMFLTKFDELFGGIISARAYTYEQTKHGKTIVPSDKELFISIGVENKIFGKNRFNIPVDARIHFAGIVALGYYFIGHVQKAHPAYFKKNIAPYVKLQSKVFREKIGIWQ